MEPTIGDLIYDWNSLKKRGPLTTKRIEFDDETLRDGIQSPSVADPATEDKLEILHLQARLGITTSDIRRWGRARETWRVGRDRQPKPSGQLRGAHAYIQPIVEVSQETGLPIEVYTFIGSFRSASTRRTGTSTIRPHDGEGDQLRGEGGMDVAFVEDTTLASDHSIALLATRSSLGYKRLVILRRSGHLAT
jgi:2-isopropylmalate synthase